MPTRTTTRRPVTAMVLAPRAPAPIIRRSNTAAIRRRYEDRLASIRRRAGAAAREDRDVIVTVAAGGVLAGVERYLPTVADALTLGPLDPASTLALGCYGLHRYGVGGHYTRSLASGFGAIALYRLVGQGLSGVGARGLPSGAGDPGGVVVTY